jgi:hypothetical protein
VTDETDGTTSDKLGIQIEASNRSPVDVKFTIDPDRTGNGAIAWQSAFA